MAGTHAQLSPSSAVRWMTCPGSVALCKDLPDSSSKYADEGTLAHEVAATCLTTGQDAIEIMTAPDDMVPHVQRYIDFVRSLGGVLMVEQSLDISVVTGEPDARGTTDAVVLLTDELVVVDLKYGMGEPVQADDNPQLQLYALAALNEFKLIEDFKTIRMVIHQPRLNSVSEWVQTAEQLREFGRQVERAAEATRQPGPALVPSTKGCRWCRAKATCVAIAGELSEDFDAIKPDDTSSDELGYAMTRVELMEGWIKAIRAECERRLLEGRTVPGFKLVQGKRGNREWCDPAEVEATLKSMRIKVEDMYDLKLISPTTAEKLVKVDVIGPRQWEKLKDRITQKEGKPSVAPESDKRPALDLNESFNDNTGVTS